MKRFISYGSIEQFRQVAKDVKQSAQFVGKQTNGKVLVNRNVRLPKVNALVTEKIHGTNASVCYSASTGMWVQSRKNIITPDKDNAGCAQSAYDIEHAWVQLIHDIAFDHDIDLEENIITVYYEWCGGNIQKNSAMSGLDKRAVIFPHIKVSNLHDPEEDSIWIKVTHSREDMNIFNVLNYKTWVALIDFERPSEFQNQMIKLVEEFVEPNSPIGKAMGKDGNTGEGVVVTFEFKDKLYRFKVKGDKHSATKVKKMEPVDLEKEQAIIDFVNYACNASRLEQAWQTVFGINNELQEPDIKLTGDFIRAVVTDIRKEETDVLEERKLTLKDIGKYVSKISRNWFITQLDKELI